MRFPWRRLSRLASPAAAAPKTDAGLWVIDVGALIPALRVVRLGGHAVDFVAHALYGAMVALAVSELAEQRPTPKPRAVRLRRVG